MRVEDLPKAELHVHLEGTLEADHLLELARRHDVAMPWRTVEEVRAAYAFSDLQSFLDVFFVGCRVLRERRDFADLAHRYLTRAAADGVVRAEVFFGPQTFLALGVPLADQLEGIFEGFDRARAETGIDAALITSAQRHRPEADALAMLDAVMPWAERIVGFGLGSTELGNPPSGFARYFATVRDRGFHATAHAGEEGGPDYVREALDVGAERIDHGVRSVEDPDLVRLLAAQRVPLTVCPLSNLRLGVVPDLAAHPVRALVDAGVLVTVNSDDPSYFRGYVGDNYRALADEAGFGDEELTALAADSLRACWR
ncbi:adenosine deaminase [Kineococcus rhizosphaerae]|uniref:Adenine deaminase n=1 Tax=Kineococcus rhizosphaerae TaxID=559628 RepID=A0A2T0QX55_9ACTN|nr:adenosine deaminase [Kineococcus rhizosphaerae]PRY10081.1 adenosine deaminase [Kineococcus rhizosphaerae]